MFFKYFNNNTVSEINKINKFIKEPTFHFKKHLITLTTNLIIGIKKIRETVSRHDLFQQSMSIFKLNTTFAKIDLRKLEIVIINSINSTRSLYYLWKCIFVLRCRRRETPMKNIRKWKRSWSKWKRVYCTKNVAPKVKKKKNRLHQTY